MSEQLAPVLRTTDAARSASWYARLGFEVEGEHRFAPNLPLYLFLRRESMRIHLSEHGGDARPNTLLYLYVDDVDAVAAEFGAGVAEKPWGMREVHLEDPDGNRLRLGQRVRASTD